MPNTVQDLLSTAVQYCTPRRPTAPRRDLSAATPWTEVGVSPRDDPDGVVGSHPAAPTAEHKTRGPFPSGRGPLGHRSAFGAVAGEKRKEKRSITFRRCVLWKAAMRQVPSGSRTKVYVWTLESSVGPGFAPV